MSEAITFNKVTTGEERPFCRQAKFEGGCTECPRKPPVSCLRMTQTLGPSKSVLSTKMEALWLGREDSGLGCQLLACGSVILKLAQTVRSLGVILDVSLSLEDPDHACSLADILLPARGQTVGSLPVPP